MKKIALFISVVITMGMLSISATKYYKIESIQTLAHTTMVMQETDTIPTKDSVSTPKQVYKASFYGMQFHGKKTASGELFDVKKLTAAHKKLAFGTKVKITNIKNNKSVIVVVNDRGPFIKHREFDLSTAAFESIASKNSGVIQIHYEIL